MDERARTISKRRLAGERVQDIAKDMGISRARAYQLLQQAHDSGERTASVRVLDISDDIDRDALAQYLRRALAQAGIAPKPPGETPS